MKYLKKAISCCAVLSSMLLGSLTFAESPFLRGFQGEDINPTTLCTSNPTGQGVAVATFESETECNSYVEALVLGSPKGYSYSNCTSSSYCMTFDTPLVGGLTGFNLVAFAATCIYSAVLEFPSNETCEEAFQASDIVCGSGTPSSCEGSLLKITGCGSEGSADSGAFSTLLNALSSFSLIQTEEGHC